MPHHPWDANFFRQPLILDRDYTPRPTMAIISPSSTPRSRPRSGIAPRPADYYLRAPVMPSTKWSRKKLYKIATGTPASSAAVISSPQK